MSDIIRNMESFYIDFGQEKSIPAEELLPERAVVFAEDPVPDKTIEDMRHNIERISSVQELVDIYANVHNKFWFIEDEVYDYEDGTDEYEKVCIKVDAWGDLMDEIADRIKVIAAEEGLLGKRQPNSGTVKQLEAFMEKYGYRDSCGWWVKINEE